MLVIQKQNPIILPKREEGLKHNTAFLWTLHEQSFGQIKSFSFLIVCRAGNTGAGNKDVGEKASAQYYGCIRNVRDKKRKNSKLTCENRSK